MSHSCATRLGCLFIFLSVVQHVKHQLPDIVLRVWGNAQDFQLLHVFPANKICSTSMRKTLLPRSTSFKAQVITVLNFPQSSLAYSTTIAIVSKPPKSYRLGHRIFRRTRQYKALLQRHGYSVMKCDNEWIKHRYPIKKSRE